MANENRPTPARAGGSLNQISTEDYSTEAHLALARGVSALLELRLREMLVQAHRDNEDVRLIARWVGTATALRQEIWTLAGGAQ